MTDASTFLPLWPETAGGTARLVNHSENHTFVVDSERGRFVLRVHPPSRSRAAIGDELGWLEELRGTDLILPRPIGGIREAEGRFALLFEFIAGHEPEPGEALFRTLGRTAATLHLNAGQGPNRPVWDEHLLDANGPWGDWRRLGRGLGDVDGYIREMLGLCGKSSDRFGLIHADMRMANLLLDGDRLAVIDFDDCGIGWFMYDLGAALSFVDTDPRLPSWVAAWLDGYRAVRPLGAEDVAVIPAMILLRRMALLGWMDGHGRGTELARTHVPGFAADTLALFRRALDGTLV